MDKAMTPEQTNLNGIPVRRVITGLWQMADQEQRHGWGSRLLGASPAPVPPSPPRSAVDQQGFDEEAEKQADVMLKHAKIQESEAKTDKLESETQKNEAEVINTALGNEKIS